jgi:hypothetical protein
LSFATDGTVRVWLSRSVGAAPLYAERQHVATHKGRLLAWADGEGARAGDVWEWTSTGPRPLFSAGACIVDVALSSGSGGALGAVWVEDRQHGLRRWQEQGGVWEAAKMPPGAVGWFGAERDDVVLVEVGLRIARRSPAGRARWSTDLLELPAMRRKRRSYEGDHDVDARILDGFLYGVGRTAPLAWVTRLEDGATEVVPLAGLSADVRIRGSEAFVYGEGELVCLRGGSVRWRSAFPDAWPLGAHDAGSERWLTSTVDGPLVLLDRSDGSHAATGAIPWMLGALGYIRSVVPTREGFLVIGDGVVWEVAPDLRLERVLRPVDLVREPDVLPVAARWRDADVRHVGRWLHGRSARGDWTWVAPAPTERVGVADEALFVACGLAGVRFPEPASVHQMKESADVR